MSQQRPVNVLPQPLQPFNTIPLQPLCMPPMPINLPFQHRFVPYNNIEPQMLPLPQPQVTTSRAKTINAHDTGKPSEWAKPSAVDIKMVRDSSDMHKMAPPVDALDMDTKITKQSSINSTEAGTNEAGYNMHKPGPEHVSNVKRSDDKEITNGENSASAENLSQTPEESSSTKGSSNSNENQPKHQETTSLLKAEDNKKPLYKPPMKLQMEEQLNKNVEICPTPNQENASTQSDKEVKAESAKRDSSCSKCNDSQQNCKCNIKAFRNSPALAIRILHPKLSPGNAVIVWNLSNSVTSESFKHLVQQFGETEEMYFFIDDPNGLFGIYVYIRFRNIHSAFRTIEALDGKHIGNTRISVEWFTQLLTVP